jgi:hypothetical protein
MTHEKTENPKAEELRRLFEGRGWKAEYEGRRQLDGWHFALTSHEGQPRNIVIFSLEVFDDWVATEILQRLNHHQWERVVGRNQGKDILLFTNHGFQLKAA